MKKHSFKGIRFQLIVGLLGVMIISSLITYCILFLSFRSNFDTLVKSNDLNIAEDLSSSIASFYVQSGSWNGLEQFMERVNISDGNEPDANDHRHNDKDQKLPVVIADNKGIPLYNGLFDRDRGGEADLPEKMKISAGTPITVNGSTIGYVFFKSMVMRSYNPQEKEFFTSLNRSIGSSLISGFILTLFMGSLLASRFARPVLLMNEAVSRVAEGDLNARVKNENQDEIGSLARNFNRMAGKLQIAEESRQNLLADIAHELRTPVSIIQANLEMIMEGIYQADEVKLKRLYRETTLLTSLISNLRSLSDLDMGMAELSPVSFDLNPMIEECCEKMRPVLEDRNIALDIRLSGDVCITADEDRLAQVVGNLLSNAVKYAPSDSTLHIVSEVVQDSGSNLVKVTVTDEGEGVPEESLEKIFNRFYRVDQSRSRSSGGRGLGLAISRKIIEMSGGRMAAFNSEGGGLAVWFQISL